MLDQGQLQEWQAYASLQPMDGAAADWRLAYLLANLVQALTGGKPKKKPKRDPDREPWSIQDFLISRLPQGNQKDHKRSVQREKPLSPEGTVAYLGQIFGVPANALNRGGG